MEIDWGMFWNCVGLFLCVTMVVAAVYVGWGVVK